MGCPQQVADNSIRPGILKDRNFTGRYGTGSVADNSIRPGILKGQRRWPPEVAAGSVADNSIRPGILKGGLKGGGALRGHRCRQLDPTGDTESLAAGRPLADFVIVADNSIRPGILKDR